MRRRVDDMKMRLRSEGLGLVSGENGFILSRREASTNADRVVGMVDGG
jgi:hypothetical protein